MTAGRNSGASLHISSVEPLCRENVIPLIKRESMEADATVNMGEKGVMKHFPQESVISEAHRPVLCNNKSPAILALRLSVLRFCYYSFLFSL